MSRRAAILGLVALAAALALEGRLPPFAALGLRGPLLLWLPGALLLAWAAPAHALALGASQRAGATVALSLTLDAALVELLGWMGVPFDVLPPAAALALAAGLALAAIGRRAPDAVRAPASSPQQLKLCRFAVALAAGYAALVLARGSTLGPGTDVGMHLATLVRAAETGAPQHLNPFIAEPVPWQYADAWHRLLASAATCPAPTASEVVGLWHAGGALAAFACVLSAALFLAEALPPGPAALGLAAAVLVADPDRFAFPAAVGQGLLWAGFGLALLALRLHSRPLALLLVPWAVGTAALHPVEAYLLPIALAAYAAALAWRARRAAVALPAFGLSALAGAAALPVVLVNNRQYLLAVAEGSVIDPSFELAQLVGPLFVVHPNFWGHDLGSPLTWLALLLVPVVAARAPEPARTLATTLAVTALLALLFPPSAALVLALGFPTFLLARAGSLFPVALLVAAGLHALGRPRTALARALLVVAAGAPAVLRVAGSPAPRQLEAAHPLLSPQGSDLLRSLPRGSILLTDLWSADFLPAGGGHYAVAGITWHASSTRDQVETRDFPSPAAPSRDAVDLLRRRRVAAVLTTRWEGSGLDWPGYGSDFWPAGREDLLRANPQHFQPSGRTARLSLWRVRLPLPERLAAKDVGAGEPDTGVPEPSLARLGDYDLVGCSTRPGSLRLELRARRSTRASPLIAAVATPAGFTEPDALARLSRLLRGPRLLHAAARLPDTFRIDHRFYSERVRRPGELVRLELGLEPPDGYDLRIGLDDDLPPFPTPLGPALIRAFSGVRCPGDPSPGGR